MNEKQCVNSLFNKTRSLCKLPASCYLDCHSHVPGGRCLSFRHAAEPFCMKYSLIDGDCWICHLSKLDVTCALLDCQNNVERNVLFFSFFFFKQCNCYLIRTEHYSSFMFNLN
uniref:Uncharacterized protein n=1 Tax=Equus asinus asinus TaxID=83772 RepID=A0A8C4PS43_EQUAS